MQGIDATPAAKSLPVLLMIAYSSMHIDSVVFNFKTKGGYIYERNLQTELKLYGIDALCL